MMKMFSHLLKLDRQHNEPVYRQIYQRIKDAIVQGTLLPDTRLPSVRVLASEVGVARGTVENAYAQLIAEGFLQSRGQGGDLCFSSITRCASITIENCRTRRTTRSD